MDTIRLRLRRTLAAQSLRTPRVGLTIHDFGVEGKQIINDREYATLQGVEKGPTLGAPSTRLTKVA